MLAALSVALMGLAGAPAAAAPVAAPPTTAIDQCPVPSNDARTIVICAQRPEGYRLNPDVMEAKRETRGAGRPVRPGGRPMPDCATVGPFPCVSAGIPILGAALTAAEMAARLAKGKEIGSMFVTDPHPTEYQLYQMAKAKREAEEAEKAALAAAKPKADLSAKAEVKPSGN